MYIRGMAHIGAQVILLVTTAGMLGACGGQGGNLATNTGSDGGQSGKSGSKVVWARSVASGQTSAEFLSVAADGLGNVYLAGDLWGPGSFDFGNGVTPMTVANYYDALLVKYDASGAAQWAQTVAAGSNESQFSSVAVDSSGDIYVTGHVYGSPGSADFGNGVTVTKSGTSGNAVLVKYNASGLAQWARAVAAASNGSSFESVTVDVSGNVYAGGSVGGTGTYDFGNGVTVTGVAIANGLLNPPESAVLAKYDSSGAAQWARSVIAGSPESSIASVAVDGAGNVYAAGSMAGTGIYDFGNGITVTGATSLTPAATEVGGNALLLKYNSSGIAQWARSPAATGGSGSDFRSVAVDSTGNAYAAGSIGESPYDFGNGVIAAGTVKGGSSTGLCCGPLYVVLAKYDASGVAQWARTVSPGGSNSYLNSITVDSSGNAFVAGAVHSTGTYEFGNGVAVATGTQGGYGGALVKYDAAGTAQWARSTANGGSSEDIFESVALDSAGNMYAAGLIGGAGVVGFGNDVTIMEMQGDAGPGWNGWSPLLVKYQ